MAGPKLGNSCSRARMSVYSPSIAFKSPTVSCTGGRAYTNAGGVHASNAIAAVGMKGPHVDFHAPLVAEKCSGPGLYAETRGPSDVSFIKGPTDKVRHVESKHQVNASYKW